MTMVLVAVGFLCTLYVAEEVLRAQAHERARVRAEDARVSDLLEAARPELFEAEQGLAQGRWTAAGHPHQVARPDRERL